MKFGSVTVSFCEFWNVYGVVFVKDVSYSNVSSCVFVVFASVVHCIFGIVLSFVVSAASFMCSVR